MNDPATASAMSVTHTSQAHGPASGRRGPRAPKTPRRQATRTVLGVKLVQARPGAYLTADGRWRIEYVEASPPYWSAERTDGTKELDGGRSLEAAVKATLRADAWDDDPEVK